MIPYVEKKKKKKFCLSQNLFCKEIDFSTNIYNLITFGVQYCFVDTQYFITLLCKCHFR